jgi:hypothetical protein
MRTALRDISNLQSGGTGALPDPLLDPVPAGVVLNGLRPHKVVAR